MRPSNVLLATAVTALLGGGYLLGRWSQATPAAAATTTSSARAAQLPVVPARSVDRPVLPARAPTRSALSGLTEDLAAQDPKIRRAAIREAARDRDVDTQLLLAASRDSDVEVAGIATVALGKRYADGQLDARELIARATDRSLADKVRVAALNGVGVVASPEGAQLLVSLVAQGSPSERAAAAILLQHQDPELAIPALIAALGDADDHVRTCAVDSLKARSRGRDFGTDRAAWQQWWHSRPR